jgi:hypothetical protein
MYDDVKIELKQTKGTIDRLKYVAAKGRIRTLQRIRRVQEQEQLKELEKEMVAEATKEAVRPEADKPVKKG